MIYTCPHCGAWLSNKAISDALKKKETVITCSFCGHSFEFRTEKTSHIVKGYDALSLASFHEAITEFNLAKDPVTTSKNTPSPDAYLGLALAKFGVQTIFKEDDTDRLEMPKLICHRCNNIYFAEDEDFLTALECCRDRIDDPLQLAEYNRLKKYAHTIDTIRDEYLKIKNSKPDGFAYSAFIAYEEANPVGYEYSSKVINCLPDKVKEVFRPDIDDYDDDLKYEAAVMYAIDHSNCMLVIADNSMDLQLTYVYTRYFHKEKSGRRIGFVCYQNMIPITMPDGRQAGADQKFDFGKPETYKKFVCIHNNIIVGGGTSVVIEDKKTKPDSKPEAPTVHIGDYVSGKPLYERLSAEQYRFGSYPQSRDTSNSVEEYFVSLGKPSADNANGWTVMFEDKNGKPYTWYRDEIIGEKKYRGIYFNKFREVFSARESDKKPSEQRLNKYTPLHIYCFAFMPLNWNVVRTDEYTVTLASDSGIDSREFNRAETGHDWEDSTLRFWLNEDFYQTAFSDEEKRILCTVGGNDDKVFLLDKKTDGAYLNNGRRAILADDYMRCLGGLCENRSINSYWIIDNSTDGYEEAAVVFPSSERNLGTQYVDSTVVSVIPKIIIRVK